ncbi:AMP-binding protein [Rhodococcus pseudokoreensis]|uniref:AMP-binding protein n=1 Tax=Rhodococcus pseudokoreensis TaxID=2811421 RepID=A0A974W5Q2_9NOCA|nr:AMP-binding protein [Rhodococcus pseudokoreensis]QSE91516.1 AMP-binding protein [Rhodococcus pseudokoreensis]
MGTGHHPAHAAGHPGPAVDYLRRSPVEVLTRSETVSPSAALLITADGTVTVAEFAARARQCASDLLTRFGVRAGDRVAIVGRNSVHRLTWQYGLYWIGAVEVSVNFELKGSMLHHVLTDSDPMLILTDEEFRDEVAAHSTGVPIHEATDPLTPADSVDRAELDRVEASLPGDLLATILYTSGTTGPSKGVMLPLGYFANHAQSIRRMTGLNAGDIGYFALPFFHVDAHIVFPAVVESEAALFIPPRFSVRKFWPDVRSYGCNWTIAVGAMLAAVATVEPPPLEEIPLTRVFGAPIPPEVYEFYEDRLGIPVLSMYGQTEADGVTHETLDVHRRGSAGVACDAFEVTILAPDGRRLPPGETGEICHRPLFPNMTLSGYWRRPDATVKAWRNLWHHTGDLGFLDEDGYLFFKGRMTDSLRRRGENISAYELEAVLRQAPGVADVAAIGVVDQLGGEDEIKALVACEDGAAFDVSGFFDHCEQRLPRYAVPRFVEQVDATVFVRSPGTGVIQKHRLSTAVSGVGIFDRLGQSPATTGGK